MLYYFFCFRFVYSFLRLVVWSRVKLVETQGWSKRVVFKVRGNEEGERNTTNKLFSSMFVIMISVSAVERSKVETTRKTTAPNSRREREESPRGDWVSRSQFQTATLMLLPDWARKILWRPTVRFVCQIWNQYKRKSFVARAGEFRFQFIFRRKE